MFFFMKINLKTKFEMIFSVMYCEGKTLLSMKKNFNLRKMFHLKKFCERF